MAPSTSRPEREARREGGRARSARRRARRRRASATRRRTRWWAKAKPSSRWALDRPCSRGSSSQGISTTWAHDPLTSTSSRILKPSGRSCTPRMTLWRRAKNPARGSRTPARRGSRSCTSEREVRETERRNQPSMPPVGLARVWHLLAMARSARPARTASTSGTSISGRCWRSPSITATTWLSAASRKPTATAPPRPPTRSSDGRWRSRTGCPRPAASRTRTGVASSESSTNSISHSRPSAVRASWVRATNGATLASSFWVGTTTVRSIVAPSPRGWRAGRPERAPPPRRRREGTA